MAYVYSAKLAKESDHLMETVTQARDWEQSPGKVIHIPEKPLRLAVDLEELFTNGSAAVEEVFHAEDVSWKPPKGPERKGAVRVFRKWEDTQTPSAPSTTEQKPAQ
jgi:hypothetical protein